VTSKNFREYSAASKTLQKVDIPAVTDEKCKETYRSLDSDQQLCAGSELGKDSCGGDSGGPLVLRTGPTTPWYQVGIVSFGPKQCGTGRPGVYTKVEAFLPWIDENLQP
jgi:secreted trypsin-like serine protease